MFIHLRVHKSGNIQLNRANIFLKIYDLGRRKSELSLTLYNNDNNNNNYYYCPLLHAIFFQWFCFVWFGFFSSDACSPRLEMLRFQK